MRLKRKIDIWEYAGTILSETGKGVLVTTKAEGKVNSMTIGWGTLGIEWGQPIYTVFVRESRHTKTMLDANGEFTINVPLGQVDKNILAVCGTKSGRDMDKIKELGLHLEEPETISVPGIRELPLTLECKVIYKQDQDPAAIDPECDAKYYAKGTRNEGDYHTVYYGEITKKALDHRRNTPLSNAALENLSIVAYNQPVTKAYVEQIRGVDSTYSISALLNKNLIEDAGRLNVPGRPIQYRTTPDFLRTYVLNSLEELPPIEKVDLGEPVVAEEAEQITMEEG